MDLIVKSAEPIIFGLVLAYLLMPVKKFIEAFSYKVLGKKIKKEEKAKKIAKNIGITGSLLFLLTIIAVLLAIIIPALITSVSGFVENLQGYMKSLVRWLEESGIISFLNDTETGKEITIWFEELLVWAKTELWPQVQSYISSIQKYLMQITSGVVSVLTTFFNFIIGIFVMIYVMAIESKLVGQSKKIIYALFPIKRANIIIETIRKSNEIFGGFLIGKIIDSAIIGLLCYIGCLILKTPSGLLVAVIVGVTNIIPFFGPFLGALVTVPLVFIQNPMAGLYLAIFILLLQQLDGNVIGPKILGDTTGLSSFWVMFAILIGGGLYGFFGMLLGVPTFAVIYYIIQQVVKSRMEKKKLPSTTEEYVELITIDEKTMKPVYESKEEIK